MSLEKYNLKLLKAIYSGKNALGEIPQILEAAGATTVAAFTDKGRRKLGLFDLVEKELEDPAQP